MSIDTLTNLLILTGILSYLGYKTWTGTSKNDIQYFFYTFFSWLIVGIIFGLLNFMEQGKSLVIDLFYGSPLQTTFNLLLVNALILFLSVIISHYPIYLRQFLFESPDQYTWNIKDNKFSFLGVITYAYNTKKIDETSRKIRFIGIFPFLAWLYIILDTYIQYHPLMYQNVDEGTFLMLPNSLIKIFLILIFGVAAWLFYDRYTTSFRNNKKVNLAIELSLIFSMIMFCLVVVSAKVYQWHIITVMLQILLTLGLMTFFILFRINRIFLEDMSFMIMKFLKRFSDYYNYVSSFRNFGFVIILILIAINAYATWAEWVNTINILMITMAMSYTIIVLWIKHWTFYTYRHDIDTKNGNLLVYPFLPGIHWNAQKISRMLGIKALAFFCLVIISSAIGNNLHELKLVYGKNKFVHHDSLLREYATNKTLSKDSFVRYYACFGGGLKAQAWNLLILEEMRKTDADFFKKLVSFSGVSGGGMGLANYAWMSQFDSITRDSMIEKICLSNITSIELSWFFGYDVLRELIPWKVWGYDRSNRVMNYYAQLMNADDKLVNNKAFTDIWNKIYLHHGYYPYLILNSTSTTQRYGIVAPIIKENIFPGSINLLTLYDTTYSIGYLEGASTCNRFPIISPAARVKGKGHFVDGGYFENSGILSTISFKNNFVNKDTTLKKSKTLLYTVANDKMKYIYKLLSDSIKNNVRVEEKNSAEFSAVLNTISDTDILPNYFREKIRYEKEFDSIVYLYLPYPISKDDLYEYFGGEILTNKKQIYSIINTSNDTIKKILKEDPDYKFEDWGIVYPALSRNIGYPAYRYMKAMLAKHPDFEILRK